MCVGFCLCTLAYLHVGGSWFVICHLPVTASENCMAPTCRYNYKIDSHDSWLRCKLWRSHRQKHTVKYTFHLLEIEKEV